MSSDLVGYFSDPNDYKLVSLNSSLILSNTNFVCLLYNRIITMWLV